jgi:glycosyltransferase involved in cell wall biosynthesis
VATLAEARARVPEPLVTVLVPTFNRSHWLPGAVASALDQTYADVRVVVSDNASTDATPEVVSAFDDPRLSYVRRQRNVSLNEHYNLCVEEISSKYVLILPDDDVLLPGAIDALLPVLERTPTVGIAHGRARLEVNDRVISSSHDMTGLTGDAVESGATFICRAMTSSHRIHATTALCRTEAMKRVPLDLGDYPATEFGVWLRLALDWDIAFVARTIAVYRMHTSTYSSSNVELTAGGYIQGPDTIQNVHDVKLRFLSEYGARLDDVPRLRRSARRAASSQLVNYAGHATLPERRLGRTILTLADCVRREPTVLLDSGAWRLLAGSVLGPRLVARIKSRRGAPAKTSQAVSR